MPTKSAKILLQAQKEKVVRYLSSVKTEAIFPEKNKKAEENLRKAGLIK